MWRNIAANFAGRAWGVISIYLFIPLYIKFLGIEAYGLVGFYSTLMATLAVADMGLTATLNREMARLSVREDTVGERPDLLRTYEIAYLCISLALAFVIWCFAPLIADRWLRANTLSRDEIAGTIRLMGIAIALQLPSGLYSGGLLGLQKQMMTNGLQIAWGVLQGLGAVLVLWLFSPTILAFASWQICSNLLYCVAVRWALWRTLASSTGQPQFKWLVFRNTWRYAAGMIGMTLIGIFLSQTDKLVASKMLPLEMFGYYTLAGALASVPQTMASPIRTAVFPRLIGLAAIGDRVALTKLYHKACALVAVAVIPAGLTLALFAGDFVFAWTGSATAAQQAGLVAALLVGGQVMQAVAGIPYYVALAHGDVRLYLYIGIVSIVLMTPLSIVLISKLGVVGAGLSWLVMNVCTLPFCLYFLHHQFLPGELRRWCLQDTGLPLIASLPCILLGRVLMPHTASRLATLALVGVVWGAAATASVLTVPELRRQFVKMTRTVLGGSCGI
jgi:O-antigen/teichoic acid export membrane protein